MARENHLAFRPEFGEIALARSKEVIVEDNTRLLASFLEEVKSKLRPSTFQAYSSYAHRFLVFMGEREVRNTSFGDVMAFLAQLEARDVKVQSLDAAVSALRQFLSFVGNEGFPVTGNWARLKARYAKDHPLGDGLQGLAQYLTKGSTETLSRFLLQLEAEREIAERELRESASKWAEVEAKRLVVFMVQRAKDGRLKR